MKFYMKIENFIYSQFKTMGENDVNPLATILYDKGLRLIGGFSYFPKESKKMSYH